MGRIKGNRDGRNSRNESYVINGKKVSRLQAIKRAEKGSLKGVHVMERNGEKYLRDNPDKSKVDNVNRYKSRSIKL